MTENGAPERGDSPPDTQDESPSLDAQSTTGSSEANRQFRGNWNRKGNKSDPKRLGGSGSSARKFKGRSDDMKQHVYNFTNPRETANSYTKTMRELVEMVGRTQKLGHYMRQSIEKMRKVGVPLPKPLAENTTETEKKIFDLSLAAYVKDDRQIDQNLAAAHTIAWGQCSPGVWAKVKSLQNYETMSKNSDIFALLGAIKSVMYKFQTTKYAPVALHKSK